MLRWLRDLLLGASYAETFRDPATRSPKIYDPPRRLTVTLTQTPLHIVLKGGPVAQIWSGVTPSGIRIHAYVAELKAVYDADAAALARELENDEE